MAEKKVIFEKLEENAKIPERQHEGDAGYDIFSSEKVILKKGDVKLVSTGLKMKLPEGIEAQIRPRSGLSLSGITVMNSPGTIDPSYRGEVKIILGNLLKDEFKIEKGDKLMTIYAGCDRKLQSALELYKERKALEMHKVVLEEYSTEEKPTVHDLGG